MLAVVQGRMPDRVPFVQYDGIAAPNEEVWECVGRENMGILRWSHVHAAHTPNCRFETSKVIVDGVPCVRTYLHTQKGTLVQEKLIEPTYGTGATKRHFIQKKDDYLILMAYLEDLVITEDLSQYYKDVHELGEDGLPHVSIGRTPFQQLWIQWVSITDLSVHLVDYPDLMADVISLMGKRLRDIFEIVRRAPVPYVVFGDNITAPVIGERYFREYCLPYYRELADMLSDRNIPVYVHMDGDLKPLWNAISESGILGIDSMSPPPDNDTSVGQAAAMWPEMRLGVNFPSSVHLASPEVIRETAYRILEEAGRTGRLQIQISENVPPGVWRIS
ncbi:MAG: uroporphyrinogen decarboxylase family protein, partial [Armatimonadota bacterium]|nr:uroporphyrinogen decarboxylase family protein [Armatimonadota bacterium]